MGVGEGVVNVLLVVVKWESFDVSGHSANSRAPFWVGLRSLGDGRRSPPKLSVGFVFGYIAVEVIIMMLLLLR